MRCSPQVPVCWIAWVALSIHSLASVEGAPAAAAAARLALEHELKAVFLVNFARFVDWAPDRPQSDAARPLRIGILGNDPFGIAVDAAVQGAKVRGRTVVVERVADPKQAASCNVVYIGASESARAEEILQTLERGGVLTVADTPAIARHGVAITLVREQERVRFEVNLDAARRANLTIGSQLLRLARSVEGRT